MDVFQHLQISMFNIWNYAQEKNSGTKTERLFAITGNAIEYAKMATVKIWMHDLRCLLHLLLDESVCQIIPIGTSAN